MGQNEMGDVFFERNGYISDLPELLRGELEKLHADKPGDAWITATDPSLPFILAGVLFLATFVFVAFYHSRINHTVGFITFTTERAIAFCFYGFFLWSFVFVTFNSIRHWGRNAFCITSFGLVRVTGEEIRVYPFGFITDLGYKAGSRSATFYDPTTGRTGLTNTEKEKRERRQEALPGKVRQGGGSSGAGFMNVFLNDGRKLQLFFPDTKIADSLEFSRKLRAMRENPPAITESLAGLDKRFMPPWARFLLSCVFFCLMTLLLGAYVVIPAHNQKKDRHYAKYYLFGEREPVASNLTNVEDHLRDYVEYYRGPFKATHWDLVREKLLPLLKDKIENHLQKEGSFKDKDDFNNMFRNFQNEYKRFSRMHWDGSQIPYAERN